MDWNILIVIGSLTLVLWWLVKPMRDLLSEVSKDVKLNSERIARIEGVIWTDIQMKTKEENIYNKVEKVMSKKNDR